MAVLCGMPTIQYLARSPCLSVRVIKHNVTCTEAYLRTKWHFDASSHLATIDIGQNLGGCCAPYGGAGFPSNTLWSGPTRTSIVHTKWHVDPSCCLTTTDMDQKVGGCCCLVTCLNYTVKFWTVITNRNSDHNGSLNQVLTVHISTILFCSQFVTNNTKFAPTLYWIIIR